MNLYNDYLSEKPKKPRNNQNKASMEVNYHSTQLNAQQKYTNGAQATGRDDKNQ